MNSTLVDRAHVDSLGGNQYRVTIGDESQDVDLDGGTYVTDDELAEMEAAGVDTENFFSPDCGDEDEFWIAAVNEAINYSGFDVKEYVAENKA